MSRRYTDRNLTPVQEVGPEDAEAAWEHFEAAGIPWWYATRMPEPWGRYYWHQWLHAFAEETLDVCNRAWRRWGAKYYAVQRDKELRDDLHDWLIVKAMEIAADYQPHPDARDPQSMWCAYLWHNLRQSAPWHFKDVVGRVQTPSGSAAAAAWNRGIASNEHLDELQAETGYAVGRHALHGTPFESADPEAVLIRLEELAAQVEQLERDDRREGIYSTSSTEVGQECLTVGCARPSVARGLCKSHYQKERRRTATTCSTDGCTNPVDARGLCGTHYGQYREQAIAEGDWVRYERRSDECSKDDCTKPVEAKGLCRYHYDVQREATAAPCAVEGCARRGTKKGMCSTHWRLSRPRKVCAVPGCETTARVRDLCKKHHTAEKKGQLGR